MRSRPESSHVEASAEAESSASVAAVPPWGVHGGNQMVVRLLRSGEPGADGGDDLAGRINDRLGQGQALPTGVRADLESRLGQSFGDVVIHRDAEAASLANRLGARAFTTGRDVFFGGGAYDPGSPAGDATLVHELTHTVQQRSGPVAGTEMSPGLFVSDPGDADERHATAVAHGHSLAAPAHAGADQGGTAVQRSAVVGHLPVASNRAVTRFVQREPFGKPKENPYQLHLDPEIEAQLRAINAMRTMLAPDQVQAGLLNLTLPTVPLAAPAPQAPPIPAPAPPAPATATGPAPGTGLMGPRPGTFGDIWKAVLAEPALGPAITALGDDAAAKAKNEFGQLSTGGKALVVTGAVTVAGGAVAGILASPDARNWFTATLTDKIIPVPMVPGLGVQLNLSGENVIVGLHLDVGKILPAALGFGPASYTAPLGAPPSAFEPVQRELMVHREPLLPGGAGGQVTDATGGAIGLQSVEGSFVLAGGKILSANFSRVLKTVGPVTVTVKLTSEIIDVHLQGGVFIDAQWPVQNMWLFGVTHRLGNNETTASVSLANDEWGDGFIDMSDSAQKAIAEMVGQIIAKTPLDRSRLRPAPPSMDTRQPPGPQGPPVPTGSAFGDKLPAYDPLKDGDPQVTLQALIANLQAMPSDGSSDVSAQDISAISVGATITINKQFEQLEAGTGVRVTAGTPVSIQVASGASVAELKGAGKGAAAIATAAKIQAIHVTCASGITIIKDNNPVASIQGVTISRGGAVSIDKFALLGDAEGAGALESLLWAGVGGLIGAGESGVPLGGILGAGKTIEEGHAKPVFIGGVVKDKVEAKLQAAFTELLAQHGRSLIPGVDLGSILGVPGAPVTAPK